MSELKEMPPMPGVMPSIMVDGAGEASAFYQRAFGAIEHQRFPAEDGKRLVHCHLEINGGALMMSDPFPEQGRPLAPSPSLVLTLAVDDGDLWWNRAVEAGCEVAVPFEVAFWGDRYGELKDPYGMNWAIVSPVKP